jgi:hypothetical protein
MTLDEKQSDILIQQLQANHSNNLSFLGDFNIDNDDDVDQRHHFMIPMSNSSTSSLSLDQVSSKTNSLPFVEVSPNQVIDQQSNDSSTSSSSQLRKKIPLSYILPKFGKAFEEAAGDPSPADFGPRCRMKQQLIKTIRDDVVNTYGVDFYPTAYEFDRMIVSVKNKFPTLTKIFGEDMVCLFDYITFFIFILFYFFI